MVLKIDAEEKELEIGEAQAAKAADAAIVNEEQLPDEIGDVKVADEVISIVAGLAAQEVNGVIGMSGSFAEGLNEFLGKKSFAKGVRITVDGHVVTAAVYVNVEYGSCIPEIALEIQEKVKEAIENMTGYEVKFVDVHIQGVARRPKSELEESLEKMDAAHAVLVVLCSLGIIGQTAITAFFATIPGNWEYAVGGIIILLVSLRLLIAGIGATGMTSLTISSADTGKVSVGKSAIEDYVAEIAKEVYGVYGVKVEAKMGEDHISIRINASIEPGINIPETTDEIKYNVRDTIKKVLGMEIGDIDLFFKQIKAKG